MGLLTQATRHDLLTALAQIPLLETLEGRTLLLRDLPADLVDRIARSSAKVLDLDAIVDCCDLWMPDRDSENPYPLRLLVQTAYAVAAGSQAGRALQALLDILPTQLDRTDQIALRRACPYPGMVAFDAADARFFYGRDTEIQILLQRLRDQHVLAVIGPSGSGKSSLVFAGLLQHLPNSAYWPAGFWHVITLRPGADPQAALTHALTGDPSTAAPLLTQILAVHSPAQRVLLVVDQAEELFTQSAREEQVAFLQTLKTLAAQRECAVLLILRADFYPDLMTSPLWPLTEGQRVEIAPLQGEALRTAIIQPAAHVGVTLEPALVERLIADSADEPGSLPLLQETLVLLWADMQGRTLTLATYAHLSKEGRSGIAVALANKADATFATLSPEQQIIARRLFLRLIQFGEGRPDTRRRQALTALRTPDDAPNAFLQTIALLTDHRLLTSSGLDQVAGDRWVDLAHEALITGWPTLQNWIIERRAAEQTRRRLEEQVAEWVRLGRGAGGLLDAAELLEVERWLESPDVIDLGLSAELIALVEASRHALQRAQAEKEEARQRELAQAQALAAAEHRQAQQQRQANRQLRQSAVGLLLLLALAIITAGLAGLKWRDATVAQGLAEAGQQTAVVAEHAAQHLARVSQAQALASQAQSNLDKDPELSLILATAALSVTQRVGELPALQAMDVMQQALAQSAIRERIAFPAREAHFVSKDTLVLLSADAVLIWNIPARQPFLMLEGLDQVVLSPNSETLLTISHKKEGLDTQVKIWDSRSGLELAMLPQQPAATSIALYTPDGERVFTIDQAGHACFWDPHNGQLMGTLAGTLTGVESVQFSPDSTRLVIAHGPVDLWDTVRDSRVTQLQEQYDANETLTFSPDNQYLAFGQQNSLAAQGESNGDPTLIEKYRTYIRYAATGAPIAILPGHDPIFSPDSQKITTVGDTKVVRTWRMDLLPAEADDPSIMQLNFPPDSYVPQGRIAYSPDSTKIVVASSFIGSEYTELVSWNYISQTLVFTTYIPIFNPTFVFYSSDGQYIVAGPGGTGGLSFDDLSIVSAHDGSLSAWTAYSSDVYLSADEQFALTIDIPHATAQVTAVQQQHRLQSLPDVSHGPIGILAPDWQHLVTFGASDVQIWAMQNDHRPPVDGTAGQYSPDGLSILTIVDKSRMKIADAKAGSTRVVLRGMGGHWSPDGQTVLGWDELPSPAPQRTLTLWDPATGLSLHSSLLNFDSPIDDIEYSRDSKVALVVLSQTVQIWDLRQWHPIAVLQGHRDEIYSAHFSPDGRTVITASADHTVKVWDMVTGHEFWTNYYPGVVSAIYSPDGGEILATSADGTAKIWAPNAYERATLNTAVNRYNWALYSPDGQTFMRFQQAGRPTWGAFLQAEAQVWDVQKRSARFDLLTGSINLAVYSYDSQWIATSNGGWSSRDRAIGLKTVQLWNNTTGELQLAMSLPDTPDRIDFSPDDYYLLASLGGQTHQYAIDPTTLLGLGHSRITRSMTDYEKALFLNDPSLVPLVTPVVVSATTPLLPAAQLAQAQTLARLGRIDEAVTAFTAVQEQAGTAISAQAWNDLCRYGSLWNHAKTVYYACEQAVQLAPADGRMLDTRAIAKALSGDREGAIRDFRAYIRWCEINSDDTPECVGDQFQRTAWIQELSAGRNPFAADLLVSLLNGHYEPISKDPNQTLPTSTSRLTSVAFSSNGQTVATGSDDGKIYLWQDLKATPRVQQVLTGHTGYVLGIAISPDSTLLASASTDKTVRLWRIADGALIRTLSTDAQSLAFAPDGRTLVVGSTDTSIQLWQVADGRLLTSLHGHTAKITRVVFSPDGQVLASADEAGTVCLWHWQDHRLAGTITAAPPIRLASLVVTVDGQSIVGGTADGHIYQWHIADGKLQQTWSGEAAINGLAVNPQTTLLVAGGGDGKKPQLWFWFLPSGQLLKHVTLDTGEQLRDLAFSPDGQILAAAFHDGQLRIWNIHYAH